MTYNTIDLCEGLAGIGQDVTLIIERPSGDDPKTAVDRLRRAGVRMRFFHPLRGLAGKIRGLAQLTFFLLSGHYRILHFESIYLTFIPGLLHRRFVLTYHSYGLPKTMLSHKATRLIAISKEMEQDAIRRHGYAPGQISIVHHGVSPRFAEPVSAQRRKELRIGLSIPTDKVIIGIVGSIQPRKGHHFLCEALATMPPEKRALVHLVFCGAPQAPEHAVWIRNVIASAGLQEQVSLIPHRDPLDVYRCLDIFCLPSVWEGFGLVVIEAMLAGNCVIRSDVQGASEQIEEGVNGFTFESENPAALRRCIERLLDNPAEMRRVGAESSRMALQRFTLKQMALNTVKVYNQLLNNR